jgi:hypothetical protein
MDQTDSLSSKSVRSWLDCIILGLTYYYLTSLIVALGFLFGGDLINPAGTTGHRFGDTSETYANWDGQWYVSIATRGYHYEPERHSSVAFFPAYPLIGGLLSRVTGLKPDLSLLILSNASFLAAMILTARYVSSTRPDEDPRLAHFVLLSMGLTPTSFFFRVAYSEGLFLALLMLVLYGLHRSARPTMIAFFVGLATATRPLGVALIPSIAIHEWKRRTGIRSFALRMLFLIPLSSWGILAYMGYLYVQYKDPIAFAHAQKIWRLRPESSLMDRAVSLIALEPIRAIYDSNNRFHWEKISRTSNPILTLRSVDSCYFLAAGALIVYGAIKRRLSSHEVVVSALLLLIPYGTIGYEQYMQSMARYSTTAMPIYMVLGLILIRTPIPVLAFLTAISGFLLGIDTALFSAWFLLI